MTKIEQIKLQIIKNIEGWDDGCGIFPKKLIRRVEAGDYSYGFLLEDKETCFNVGWPAIVVASVEEVKTKDGGYSAFGFQEAINCIFQKKNKPTHGKLYFQFLAEANGRKELIKFFEDLSEDEWWKIIRRERDEL